MRRKGCNILSVKNNLSLVRCLKTADDIPANVKIGKNTAISGETTPEDYPDGVLESGETLIKEGDLA